MKLFYPRVEKRLDFHNIEFLDTEIFTDLHDGSRREADVVAKLRSRDGRPELVRGLAIEDYLVSASRLPSSRLVSTKVDAWVSARTTSGIRKCPRRRQCLLARRMARWCCRHHGSGRVIFSRWRSSRSCVYRAVIVFSMRSKTPWLSTSMVMLALGMSCHGPG